MPSLVYKEIGAMIREQRILKGMTQLELANQMGYDTSQFVSLFERGVSKVPVKALGKLCVILRLPEKKLLRLLKNELMDEITLELQDGKNQILSAKQESRDQDLKLAA